MGQARANENAGDERNIVRDRSIRELSYAVIATGITLVLAVLFYWYVPQLRQQMRDKDEGLKHTRVFVAEPQGGRIRYEFTETDGGESQAEALKHYVQDLELLGRRFERGQFSMVLLPGMTDTPEYASMVQNAGAFQYSVEKSPTGPELVIRTAQPAARAALHDYLKYLETRWVF